GIGAADRLRKPGSREHDARVVGVETHRRAKEAAEGLRVARTRAGEHHFLRHPLPPAQLAQDVAGERERALVDLIRAGQSGLVDRVRPDRDVVVLGQSRDADAVIEAEVAIDRPQRAAYIGGVARKRAEKAQRSESRLPADEQSEMAAAASLHARAKQTANVDV